MKMDTTNSKSPIAKIHADGYQAVIDGDNQIIIGKVRPCDVPAKIHEMESAYDDVSQDADGDIVFYRNND